ncbi:MAG: peptidylprolyl isomerase, partial [Clostridiales bacterium]|nr:peptidylprolyl isomerase [Clostridiales bacterium]
MSKKKNTYSLTAKERKELRRAEREKANKKSKEDRAPEVESVEPTEGGEAVAPQEKINKKSLWILICSVTLGLLIILLAILLPFVIKNDNSKYPRAVIKLRDGRQIEMVIWEEDCPIAATNFIFLAKIGFFDGTIFYDVKPERNYMRIGNFTGYSSNENKTDNEAFLAGIPQSMLNVTRLEQLEDGRYVSNANINKLGYYLQ